MRRWIYFYIPILVASMVLVSQRTTRGWAENRYDIKELTPEIKSALDSRRARFDVLKSLKQKGIVGENNRGYVELLGGDSDAKNLVDLENKDRRFVYEKIAEQNNLPPGSLSTVESIFAQVQRDKADPGERIQDAAGNWVHK